MKGEFYKMEFRAWNLGTVDLTLEQEAAYLRLCHAMYDVGGPVPNSTRFLQGIFRCGNTKAATLVDQLIAAGKIALTADGRLFNHRVSEELQARERVSAVRRAAGERGGSATRATGDRTPTDLEADAERDATDSRANGAKPLRNNNAGEANASASQSREEERRGDKKDPQDPDGSSPKGANGRGHHIPDLFETKPEAWEVCRQFGYCEDEIPEVLAEFCDFWGGEAGQRARKRDWIKTLRNRLRNIRGTSRRKALPARSAASGGRQLGMLAIARKDYPLQ